MLKKLKMDINTISQMIYASALIMMFDRGENMLTGVMLFIITWIVCLLSADIPEGLGVVEEVLEYLGTFFKNLQLGFWAAGIVELALGKYALGGIIIFMALVLWFTKKFFPLNEEYRHV